MSEEKYGMTCSFASVLILVSFIVFFVGVFAGRKGFSLKEARTEEYYQERCALIYAMATDYIFCDKTAEKMRLKARLIREINSYNRETEGIEWHFRCPPFFELYYLTGEEE